jgi:transcriptional regulator with XRE-family HTH domain
MNSPTDYCEAGTHIRAWRTEHGLSKRAAGRILGLTGSHIGYLESGQRFASPLIAEALSKLTGQPITVFLNMKAR